MLALRGLLHNQVAPRGSNVGYQSTFWATDLLLEAVPENRRIW
jgi:hypothetical protein